MLCYAKKYYRYLDTNSNLGELELLTNDVKTLAVKALLLLSKYKGVYAQFKNRLNENGIKLHRPDSLNAFLRILNASDSDLPIWYRETIPVLRENEQIFTKFLLQSGLRTTEAINSFNKIIQLAKEDRLKEYYNEELNCLCHYKFPSEFIRRTKNCYITFISVEFLKQITNSETVTYSSIKKWLDRHHKTKMRFNELRDCFGTYLLHHGLLEQEVNLLQGRIPISVFVRHYWSPKLKELSTKVIALTEDMEKTLI